jgi:hypothetical protein
MTPIGRCCPLQKKGISKKDLKEALNLSDQQFRRHSAELVDMELMHLDPNNGVLITTAEA